VTDNDPLYVEVLQLIAADLSGEGTLASLADVLTGDLDVLIEESLYRSDVNTHWSNYDFKFGLIKLSLVENILNQVLD